MFRCIKRKKTIALLKYILFMINSVWAVSFCFGLFVSFLISWQFVPMGREIWSQDFPQGLEGLPWFDQGLCQIPLFVPGLGGWGFQLTSALLTYYKHNESTHVAKTFNYELDVSCVPTNIFRSNGYLNRLQLNLSTKTNTKWKKKWQWKSKWQ